MDELMRELRRRAEAGDPAAREQLEQAWRRAGLVPIPVPWLGEAQPDAHLLEWCLAPGDRVRRDQPLAVLETDKASVELVAPADGVLAAIEVPVGAQPRVGTVLALLGPPPPGDPELERRHEELLAAVAAAPRDETPRAAYADFLRDCAARGQGVGPWGAETTGLRGELIRLHLRARDELDPAAAERLRQLVARAGRTALELLPFACSSPRVEGGFVVGVAASADWLLRRWGDLAPRTPLTSLGVSHADADQAARLAALLGARHLRALELGPEVGPAALQALVDPGRLRADRLELRDVEPVPALTSLRPTELVLVDRAPPPWLAGSTVTSLELHATVPDEAALAGLLAAVPSSVGRVAARAWLPGWRALPEETIRELVGPRYRPPG